MLTLLSAHTRRERTIKLSARAFSLKTPPMKSVFSASPIIYLDDFYRDLCNGSSFEEIAETICKFYRNAKHTGDFKLKDLSDFGKMKEKIIYKLVNLEMNKDLFERYSLYPVS